MAKMSMAGRSTAPAMTTKTNDRSRLHGGATNKASYSRNHTGQDPHQDFSLGKLSRIDRQHKRSWQRGQK